MEQYTHNLQIAIVVSKQYSIDEEPIIKDIKKRISNHTISYRSDADRETEYFLTWHREPLSMIQTQFMGDLFAVSAYGDNDDIIIEHTEHTLRRAEKELKEKYQQYNWSIVFHISRVVQNTAKCRMMVDCPINCI
jgi:hypothetical protein